jgi:hypothetical protein
MKKIYSVLIVVLTLSIFACTLGLPSSVQFKGDINLRFAASMNFGDLFADLISDSLLDNEEIEIIVLDCINAPDYQTYLIYMEAFSEYFDMDFDIPSDTITVTLPNGDTITIDISDHIGDTVTLNNRMVLFDSLNEVDDEPSIFPLSALGEAMDDFLRGFNFSDDVLAHIYFSGSDIISVITIEVQIGDDPSRKFENIVAVTENIIDLDSSVYSQEALPLGGIEIENFADLLNKKQDLEINLKIYVEEGEEVQIAWLSEAMNITAELAVWLPLVFVAEEPDGAELIFPGDFFDSVGGFITNLNEFVDSLSLIVGMPQNPLGEGILIMQSGKLEVKNPLNAHSLTFAINKENMEEIIAQGDNFEPEFSIFFGGGKRLGLPREFGVTTVALQAGINYTPKLGGGE